MRFYKSLFYLRKERGLTQEAVADGAGLALRTYQNYERGQREPTLSALISMADFYNISLDEVAGRDWPKGTGGKIKVTTLLENTACRKGLCHAHGLSLYIETPSRRILFDMGPDDGFIANAQALGVDLAAVDLAILSHGHYDHGGGLAAFCRLNGHAPIYIHRAAFGAFYALDPEPRYIGLPLGLEEFRHRFVLTGEETGLGRGLTLFADPPQVFDALSASAKLREKVGMDYPPDPFRHEQSLLVEAAGKALLVAGCAHRGIVNILAGAEARLGRLPDAVFGGFHFFELDPADPESGRLIAAAGEALTRGDTVYYTGHCTGEYAYGALSAILGERLRPMTGGSEIEI